MIVKEAINPISAIKPISTIKPIAISADMDSQPAYPLRVGIVGLGTVGLKRTAHIQVHPDLVLQAVCDINPELTNTLPGVNFYVNFQDLIQADLDIVFVAAYNNIAPDVFKLNTATLTIDAAHP